MAILHTSSLLTAPPLEPLLSEDATRTQGPWWYSLYGLPVRSEVRLPLRPLAPADGRVPAWVMARRPSRPPTPDGPMVAQIACDGSCRGNHTAMELHRGPGGTWFWFYRIGTIHISPDARTIDVYPDADADERALAMVLAGPVSVFVLHQLGYPTLHASAVVTDRGTVAFFGPKGRGKSTMAASFLRAGATLLTDDVLPLQLREDGVYGLPGLPTMKLWPEAVERALELSEELPNVMASTTKKLLALDGRYAFQETPTPLRALYVLDRYDGTTAGGTEVAVRALAGVEALQAVLGQISFGAFLTSAEEARFLPVYARLLAQAPVRVLCYPDGFAHREAVLARILTDLGAR